MLKLIYRNLLHHPLRSLLTVGSLIVAMFTICVLRSIVTTLNSGLEGAQADRLVVQSAVSLFVDLPLSYQGKIKAVGGVERVCKWQWFGGYYQDPSNFFAQFCVDMPEMLEIYDADIDITDGSPEKLLDNRIGCMIGTGLAEQFGFKVGDTIPLIGALFRKPDGSAWEFTVEAIYTPRKSNFDNRTMFFHWKYFDEVCQEIFGESIGTGTYVLQLRDPGEATQVMSEVDALFENGPQRVQTTSEAEFARQFISMLGNVPTFIGAIGGGVLIAILLACVNTMLMAGREQEHAIGILKALGFPDRSSSA